MAISESTSKRILVALASKEAGNEVVDAVNKGLASATQSLLAVIACIVATSTSTTTDFASLAAGDLVLVLPATAGNGKFGTVVTAGTLPFAAVIGSAYTVLRTVSLPATSTLTF
jgi:ribosomal protein S5